MPLSKLPMKTWKTNSYVQYVEDLTSVQTLFTVLSCWQTVSNWSLQPMSQNSLPRYTCYYYAYSVLFYFIIYNFFVSVVNKTSLLLHCIMIIISLIEISRSNKVLQLLSIACRWLWSDTQCQSTIQEPKFPKEWEHEANTWCERTLYNVNPQTMATSYYTLLRKQNRLLKSISQGLGLSNELSTFKIEVKNKDWLKFMSPLFIFKIQYLPQKVSLIKNN